MTIIRATELSRLAAQGMNCLPNRQGGGKAINRYITSSPGWRRKQA